MPSKLTTNANEDQPISIKKPAERRLTNDVRLPNGRFGSKASKETSEGKQADLYQLYWSEELEQNLFPREKASNYDLGDESTSHACLYHLLSSVTTHYRVPPRSR